MKEKSPLGNCCLPLMWLCEGIFVSGLAIKSRGEALFIHLRHSCDILSFVGLEFEYGNEWRTSRDMRNWDSRNLRWSQRCSNDDARNIHWIENTKCMHLREIKQMQRQNENKTRAEKIDKYLGMAAIAVPIHLPVFQGCNLILLRGNRRRVWKHQCENSGE